MVIEDPSLETDPVGLPASTARVLRIARRAFGATAAAWVPIGPEDGPAVLGDVDAGLMRVVASRAAEVGAGFIVADVGAVPVLSALAYRYDYLAAVPVRIGEPGAAVLIVLGNGAPPSLQTDDALLADLAELAADAAAADVPADGRVASGDGSATAPLDFATVELERIFSAAPDAIMFSDPDRVVRRVNAAACRLYGYSAEQMVGMPTSALYANPVDYELFGRLRFNEAAVESLDPFRLWWKRRDGSSFIGETVGAPMVGPDGAFLGYISIVRDVTDLLRVEEALEQAGRRLRMVVDNLPVILYGLAPDGTFTLSEGRALDALGVRSGEIVGRHVTDLYGDNPDVVKNLSKALAGESITFRTTLEGTIFENRTVPIADPDGPISEIIGIAMDVTLQADIEDALRLAKREAETNLQEAQAMRASAEEAAQAQSRFLASMSHEIRTPLTGIIGFADLLATVASGEAQEYAELIRRSGHRLLETLNSVLNLARLDARQVAPRFREADLATEVGEAASLLRPLAESRGLRFDVHVAPVQGITDPSLLHRIVTNLIGNAIKFTDQGSVSVTVRPEADGALIQVADTGRGMDPGFLPHLFEPFRREDDDYGQPSGTGLGLTITKRLLDLLGGTVTVETQPGEGSVFSLHLPLTPPAAPAGDEDAPVLTAASRDAEPPHARSAAA